MSSQDLREQLRRNLPLRNALEQLLEARRGAEALKVDAWTLAVEMSSLLQAGCTPTQLRLLVAGGYVEHAEDVTRRSDRVRTFRPESPMKFGPRTCFVLTEAGLKLLEAEPPSAESKNGRQLNGPTQANGVRPGREVPVWDSDSRELRVRGEVVKRFHRPAPVLELVLAAFEEMGWPPHLDDPLPPEHGVVAEERLRDAVRRLNRCQALHCIRFESDGLGAGIRWGWVARKSQENHG